MTDERIEEIRAALATPISVVGAGIARSLLDEVDRLRREAREEWDDAIHIAAPWETRSALCGAWNRNLVDLDERPRPDGMAGCWTCLMAAEWIDAEWLDAATGRRKKGDDG